MSITVVHLDQCPAVSQHGFERRSVFNPALTGCDRLSLEFVELQTGEESSPHAHLGTHTMVYTISGSVRIYFGKRLETVLDVCPGDCVHIPPDVIHYVVNAQAMPMRAVVARSPARHEVVEYPELRTLVVSRKETSCNA